MVQAARRRMDLSKGQPQDHDELRSLNEELGDEWNCRRTRRLEIGPRCAALGSRLCAPYRFRLRAVHALSWPFGVISPGLEDEAPRHLSFDEVEAIYRASITAVFDEIHPRPDWLIQFARGDAGPVLVRQSQDASLLVIGTPNM